MRMPETAVEVTEADNGDLFLQASSTRHWTRLNEAEHPVPG